MKVLFFGLLFTLASYEASAGIACPSGWVCPSTPIYTSKIGSWYSLYWNAPGKPHSHWSEWTRYQPLAGYYTSGDSNVITSHFSQMKSAGIEFVIFDNTNGTGNDGGTIDQNMRAIINTNDNLKTNSQLKFSVALGFGLWGARSVEAHNREADYIWNDFAQNRNHYQINGKPLLVNYNSYESKECFAADWNDQRFSVRKAGGMIDGSDPFLQKYSNEGLWGWVIKSPQIKSPEAITVMPGWHTRHLGRNTTPIERQNGIYYMKQWLFAIKNNPRHIVIASWNDWAEETSIEPARSVSATKWTDAYGTETPDLYLQITTAYGNLKTGLINGYYYKDEDDATVYQVVNGGLVAQGAMPRGKAVVYLPAGTIKNLNSSNTPGSGVGQVESIPAGLFKVGAALGYSNGSAYCLFANMNDYTAATGKKDASGVNAYSNFPSKMKNDGTCGAPASAPPSPPSPPIKNETEIIPEGLFKVGATLGYSSGASAYCLFDSMKNFTKITGKTDASNIKDYPTLPTKMKSDGICRGN